MPELIEGEDYYWERDRMVFTRQFHLKRGQCCGSGCRHCPYQPRWTKGATTSSVSTPTDQSETR
ncbi:MAG: hypothetical protein JNJ50_06635 [Acidobacteria bacterium]|nr:hypothetical protein [Acidobacteriota bacterium]